jgi:hypothetical protein
MCENVNEIDEKETDINIMIEKRYRNKCREKMMMREGLKERERGYREGEKIKRKEK